MYIFERFIFRGKKKDPLSKLKKNPLENEYGKPNKSVNQQCQL